MTSLVAVGLWHPFERRVVVASKRLSWDFIAKCP